MFDCSVATVVGLKRRDNIEIELRKIRGVIETAQAALINREASPEAIHDALDAAVFSVETIKTLCLDTTPT
jgi:hypothetical protein